MKTYTLKKITGTPDWSAVPVMPIDTLLWTDSIDVTAQAQLCWDADALYLRMEATEPNIRMEETDPLAEVCNDSCLEFFLQPTDAPEYLNFEMNPVLNSLMFPLACALWFPILKTVLPLRRSLRIPAGC